MTQGCRGGADAHGGALVAGPQRGTAVISVPSQEYHWTWAVEGKRCCQPEAQCCPGTGTWDIREGGEARPRRGGWEEAQGQGNSLEWGDRRLQGEQR